MESGLLRKTWNQRWVALVPNGLLVFKSSSSAPKKGTAAMKTIVVEKGLWEGVDPIEAKRNHVLSLAQDGEVCVWCICALTASRLLRVHTAITHTRSRTCARTVAALHATELA